MKKILLTLTLFSVLAVSPAFGFGGCEENCQKCHSLNKQEVQEIFTKLQAPDAKVTDIRMSPIKGLWEVSIEDKGMRGLMYIGFSKKYIVGGPIFEIETASNKSQESLQKANNESPKYVDAAAIPLGNALLLGQKDARYKVVVFTDPDCPFCGKLHEELKKVVAENKEIAFYLKLMPLAMHPDARWKSESILCSKSLRLLEDNFEKKPIPRPDCDTKDVDENTELAQALGITGTPTLVMPDGQVVIGAKDAGTITDLVLHPPKKEK
ncbi:MAG: DsbC family protein [Nitrospirota bacterium]|nr:DsbC family protein [Nitrospirota bacterium]